VRTAAAAVPGRFSFLQTAAFGYPEFRRYYAGQGISVIGTWMQSVAAAWLVLQLSGNSAVALAVYGTCQYGPTLILGLFAGTLVDRFVHRDLLLLTQVVSALGACAYAALTLTHAISLPIVFAIAILLGVNQALYFPSRQATVLEMVGRGDLASAVALNATAFNLARIVGPAIAGLVIAAVGVAACFWLNALSYVAVILVLLTIGRRPAASRSGQSTLELIGEGLDYVRRSPTLVALFSLLLVAAMFGANFSLVLPLFTRVTLHANADLLGYLFAAQGAGALLGALTMTAAGRALTDPRRVIVGGIFFGVVEILFALRPGFTQALVLLLVIGWSFALYTIGTNVLVQMQAPDRMQGRIVSVYSTIFIGTTPFGYLFAGLVAHALGPSAAVWVGGAITATTGVLVLAISSARDRGGHASSH
jgi:predicted MFS family arabinose efflux permease